eukprot:gene57919-biopygen40595
MQGWGSGGLGAETYVLRCPWPPLGSGECTRDATVSNPQMRNEQGGWLSGSSYPSRGCKGVLVTGDGNYLVTSEAGGRIMLCTPDAVGGGCITVAGGNGDGDGANQLHRPTGAVSLTANGDYIIRDQAMKRYQRCPAMPNGCGSACGDCVTISTGWESESNGLLVVPTPSNTPAFQLAGTAAAPTPTAAPTAAPS